VVVVVGGYGKIVSIEGCFCFFLRSFVAMASATAEHRPDDDSSTSVQCRSYAAARTRPDGFFHTSYQFLAHARIKYQKKSSVADVMTSAQVDALLPPAPR
jgi:hypothetical protein